MRTIRMALAGLALAVAGAVSACTPSTPLVLEAPEFCDTLVGGMGEYSTFALEVIATGTATSNEYVAAKDYLETLERDFAELIDARGLREKFVVISAPVSFMDAVYGGPDFELEVDKDAFIAARDSLMLTCAQPAKQ